MTSTIAIPGERCRRPPPEMASGSVNIRNGEAVPISQKQTKETKGKIPLPSLSSFASVKKLTQGPAVVARDALAQAGETSGTSAHTHGATGARVEARAPFRVNGSKGGPGVWKRIISEMPPHSLYVEAFAGSAQILFKKRPAQTSIAIDSDKATCAALACSLAANGDSAGVTVICDDAVSWLEKHRGEFNQRTVVYCDPPYLYETRSGGRRRYYTHEKGETWSHTPLLGVLTRLAAAEINVLLSGYRSKLYDQMLMAWRRIDYTAGTRGGGVTESLWCSFDPPAQLHDYRWLGTDYRERERLKRKKARWLGKLRRMTPIEAAAILAALDEWRAV